MRPFLAPPVGSPLAPGPVPSFSMVIPAYQAAGYVGRAVESVLAQTVPAAEIIVADDGSTDDLAEALAPYGDQVKLVRGPHGGPPVARNRGYRAATAEFVANLDADDVLYPTWLEAVGELAAARPDLDILTTNGYLVHDGRRLRRCYFRDWPFEIENQRREILRRNFVISFAVVRRSRFLEIGGFDESLFWADDWDFWLRLLLEGARAGCVDETLYEYTVREGSVATRPRDVLRDCIRLLEKPDVVARLEPGERRELARSIARQRQELVTLELQESLVRGQPGFRRSALAVAFGPGYAPAARVKVGAWAVAPGPVRRRLERRNAREWIGAGGAKIARGAGGGADAEPTRRRPVRVAFYCDADEVGGAEVSLGNLLAALSPRIDAVVVGTNRHVVDWLGGHRPEAPRKLLSPIANDLELRPIAEHFRAIRRLRPDILHVSLNSPWASHWAILFGLAIPDVRVVAVEQLPQPTTRVRRRALKRLTAPRLAAHVAVGERSSREVARLAGVRPESIRTIYNGVPEVELEPLPRPGEGPVIGSLGRLEPQKGFDVLVQSLRELPDVTAVIVGNGSERDRLVRLAERLDVSDRLVLPGRRDDARRYLTTFDVFVLPSRFEAFPLAIVEAMLAGLPVVATSVGSVAEAVVDGQTGRLVSPDEPSSLAGAVRDLLEDPEGARELGRRGREAAMERFTSSAMARAFEELYDEVTR